MVVFLGCLFVGIDWGLLFGVGLAVVIQLGYITFPTLHVLGRLPGTALLRSVPALCCALVCNNRMQISGTVRSQMHDCACCKYEICRIHAVLHQRFTILEMYSVICFVMASASISYPVKR